MATRARVVQNAEVGALGFDTVAPITDDLAAQFCAAGFRFAVRYLGSLTSAEVDRILDAGLAVMPVTYGLKVGTAVDAAMGRRYGASTVANAQSAGMPRAATVWLDLETVTGDVAPFVDRWAETVQAGGFVPGLYVGAGAQLSSVELYALKVVRYWHSLSRVTDRNNALAEPACGWCMYQLYPTVRRCGIDVDIDVVQQDYRGRVPTWVTGS